jgi:hypothetical protein
LGTSLVPCSLEWYHVLCLTWSLLNDYCEHIMGAFLLCAVVGHRHFKACYRLFIFKNYLLSFFVHSTNLRRSIWSNDMAPHLASFLEGEDMELLRVIKGQYYSKYFISHCVPQVGIGCLGGCKWGKRSQLHRNVPLFFLSHYWYFSSN